MLRLASLLGVACFALAALALKGTPARIPANSRLGHSNDKDPNKALERLVRTSARGYHAGFSLN